MKKYIVITIMFFALLNFANAVPKLTSFSVISSHLQNGKIKVKDNSSNGFIAKIGATRTNNASGGYENVQMEVTFYAVLYNTVKTLKVINISSADFSGYYLENYNEISGKPSAANNSVEIAIPNDMIDGEIFVKYRYKDYTGTWVSYINGNVSYKTINISPLPEKARIYLGSFREIKWGWYDIYKFTTDNVFAGYESKSYGINFLAYTSPSSVSRLGTVPIYEHKYTISDANGVVLNDGGQIYFYTVNEVEPPPTPPVGFTYKLLSRGIAFYAYYSNTIPGLLPVYQCNLRSYKNTQLYRTTQGDLNEDLWSKEKVAFYAFPVPNTPF